MLERFVGTWRAKETLHPSPWNALGRPAEGSLVARLALGGGALIMEYRRDDYEGVGVMRSDPRGAEVRLWWFDALGPPGPAKGGVRGEGLVLEGESPVGRVRYTYTFVRDGAFTFRIEHSRDGKAWQAYVDAEYERL